MKIYLLDDDLNILLILEKIITDRQIGEVCGYSVSSQDALEDLRHTKPDIMILDLLMPEIDGITFLKQASLMLPDCSFVMISQVSTKDMIADAYSSGVEFYIQKPLNSIEVETVLRNVIQKKAM